MKGGGKKRGRKKAVHKENCFILSPRLLQQLGINLPIPSVTSDSPIAESSNLGDTDQKEVNDSNPECHQSNHFLEEGKHSKTGLDKRIRKKILPLEAFKVGENREHIESDQIERDSINKKVKEPECRETDSSANLHRDENSTDKDEAYSSDNDKASEDDEKILSRNLDLLQNLSAIEEIPTKKVERSLYPNNFSDIIKKDSHIVKTNEGDQEQCFHDLHANVQSLVVKLPDFSTVFKNYDVFSNSSSGSTSPIEDLIRDSIESLENDPSVIEQRIENLIHNSTANLEEALSEGEQTTENSVQNPIKTLEKDPSEAERTIENFIHNSTTTSEETLSEGEQTTENSVQNPIKTLEKDRSEGERAIENLIDNSTTTIEEALSEGERIIENLIDNPSTNLEITVLEGQRTIDNSIQHPITVLEKDRSADERTIDNSIQNPITTLDVALSEDERTIENLIESPTTTLESTLSESERTIDNSIENPITILEKDRSADEQTIDNSIPNPITTLDEALSEGELTIETLIHSPITTLEKEPLEGEQSIGSSIPNPIAKLQKYHPETKGKNINFETSHLNQEAEKTYYAQTKNELGNYSEAHETAFELPEAVCVNFKAPVSRYTSVEHYYTDDVTTGVEHGPIFLEPSSQELTSVTVKKDTYTFSLDNQDDEYSHDILSTDKDIKSTQTINSISILPTLNTTKRKIRSRDVKLIAHYLEIALRKRDLIKQKKLAQTKEIISPKQFIYNKYEAKKSIDCMDDNVALDADLFQVGGTLEVEPVNSEQKIEIDYDNVVFGNLNNDSLWLPEEELTKTVFRITKPSKIIPVKLKPKSVCKNPPEENNKCSYETIKAATSAQRSGINGINSLNSSHTGVTLTDEVQNTINQDQLPSVNTADGNIRVESNKQPQHSFFGLQSEVNDENNEGLNLQVKSSPHKSPAKSNDLSSIPSDRDVDDEKLQYYEAAYALYELGNNTSLLQIVSDQLNEIQSSVNPYFIVGNSTLGQYLQTINLANSELSTENVTIPSDIIPNEIAYDITNQNNGEHYFSNVLTNFHDFTKRENIDKIIFTDDHINDTSFDNTFDELESCQENIEDHYQESIVSDCYQVHEKDGNLILNLSNENENLENDIAFEKKGKSELSIVKHLEEVKDISFVSDANLVEKEHLSSELLPDSPRNSEKVSNKSLIHHQTEDSSQISEICSSASCDSIEDLSQISQSVKKISEHETNTKQIIDVHINTVQMNIEKKNLNKNNSQEESEYVEVNPNQNYVKDFELEQISSEKAYSIVHNAYNSTVVPGYKYSSNVAVQPSTSESIPQNKEIKKSKTGQSEQTVDVNIISVEMNITKSNLNENRVPEDSEYVEIKQTQNSVDGLESEQRSLEKADLIVHSANNSAVVPDHEKSSKIDVQPSTSKSIPQNQEIKDSKPKLRRASKRKYGLADDAKTMISEGTDKVIKLEVSPQKAEILIVSENNDKVKSDHDVIKPSRSLALAGRKSVDIQTGNEILTRRKTRYSSLQSENNNIMVINSFSSSLKYCENLNKNSSATLKTELGLEEVKKSLCEKVKTLKNTVHKKESATQRKSIKDDPKRRETQANNVEQFRANESEDLTHSEKPIEKSKLLRNTKAFELTDETKTDSVADIEKSKNNDKIRKSVIEKSTPDEDSGKPKRKRGRPPNIIDHHEIEKSKDCVKLQRDQKQYQIDLFEKKDMWNDVDIVAPKKGTKRHAKELSNDLEKTDAVDSDNLQTRKKEKRDEAAKNHKKIGRTRKSDASKRSFTLDNSDKSRSLGSSDAFSQASPEISKKTLPTDIKTEPKDVDSPPSAKKKKLASKPMNKNLICGLCKEQIIGHDAWLNHVAGHDYITWIEGENPVDLKDEKEVIRCVARMKQYFNMFTCNKCGEKRLSARGFVSHLTECRDKPSKSAKKMGETSSDEGEPLIQLKIKRKQCKCAICKETIDADKWFKHSQISHYYLAWKEGDPPVNLQRTADINNHLQRALKKFGKLTCHCGEARASVVGFQSHVSRDHRVNISVVTETNITGINDFVSRYYQEPKTPNVRCAVCREEMDATKWRLHAMQQHYNLAWFEGGEPIELKNMKICGKILQELFNFSGQFQCSICNEMRYSVMGFYAHVLICGRNEEELDKVKINCRVCNGLFLPTVISLHERACAMKEKLQMKSTVEGEFNPKSKRQAAVRAQKTLEMICETDPKDVKSKQSNDDYAFSASGSEYEVSDGEHQQADEDDMASAEEIDDDDSLQEGNNSRNGLDSFRRNPVWMDAEIQMFGWSVSQARSLEDQVMRRFKLSLSKEPLFTELACKSYEVLNDTDTECYLPPLKQSALAQLKNTSELRNYKLFETEIGKSHSAIFAGGPITCMTWLPTRSHMPKSASTEGEFLAIATNKAIDVDGVDAGNTTTEKTFIQFWRFEHLNNYMARPEISLSLALAFDFGPIWAMDWCPSGGHSDPSSTLQRLGLLAVCGNNGVVYVYAVCKPEDLKESENPYYKTDPVLELRLYTCSGTKEVYQATAVHWSTLEGHKRVYVGYANGLVASYDLTADSPLTRKIVDGKTILYPNFEHKVSVSIIYGVAHLMEDMIGVTGIGGTWIYSGDRCIQQFLLPSTNIQKMPAWPGFYFYSDSCSQTGFLACPWRGFRRLGQSLSNCMGWRSGIALVDRTGVSRQPHRNPLLNINWTDSKIQSHVVKPLTEEQLDPQEELNTYDKFVKRFGIFPHTTSDHRKDYNVFELPLTDADVVAACPDADQRLARAYNLGFVIISNFVACKGPKRRK